MSSLAVVDKIIPLTSSGRLVDSSQWNLEVAEALAQLDSLVLTGEHWEIIDFLRAYYREYGISPVLKLLKHGLQEKFGPDKSSDEYLNRLFPASVQFQGTKLAGIPVPKVDAELDQNEQIDQIPGNEEKSIQADQIEFDGNVYRVSQTGNLVDLHNWDEELAVHMAELEGIQLTKDHWEILGFLRKFFFDFGITPMVKILIKHLAKEIGKDKSNKAYLYELFPLGPSRQGSRIAGLPAPQGCQDP